AEFLAEEAQADEDEGSGAAAFLGYFSRCESFHAVKAKNGIERRFYGRLPAVECMDQGEGFAGRVFRHWLVGLRREARKDLAGGGEREDGAFGDQSKGTAERAGEFRPVEVIEFTPLPSPLPFEERGRGTGAFQEGTEGLEFFA